MDSEITTYFSLFWGCFLAATVIPFASEAIFFGALKLSGEPVWLLLLTASLGNTAGGITGYLLGKLAKWQWLEKYFRIKQSSILKYEVRTKKYGYWLALLCWLPVVGDLLCVVLGFFRTALLPVAVLMFIGKAARYAVVALVAGHL